MMHEFSHTAGFDDLDPEQYPDYLMGYGTDSLEQLFNTIPDEDINDLGQHYQD